LPDNSCWLSRNLLLASETFPLIALQRCDLKNKNLGEDLHTVLITNVNKDLVKNKTLHRGAAGSNAAFFYEKKGVAFGGN